MKEHIERPSWMSPEEEARILTDVEDQLLSAFRVQCAQNTARQSEQRTSSLWSSLQQVISMKSSITWATALSVLAVVWMSFSPTVLPLEQLTVERTLSSRPLTQQTSASGSISERMQVVGHHTQTGSISEGSRWKIAVGPTATLSILRTGKQQRTVKMKRGFIRVHVTPNQVKKFSVQCKEYQVWVRGTIFSVEKEHNWLRVEVQRGKVVVRGPQFKTGRVLTKGQGIRLNTQTKKANMYTLPAQLAASSKASMKHFQWLMKISPKRAFEYAVDLVWSHRWSTPQRRTLLERFEKVLFKRKKKEAFLLRIQLARLYKGINAQMHLYTGLKECLKVFPNPTLRCRPFVQEYIKRFPQGEFRSQIQVHLKKK